MTWHFDTLSHRCTWPTWSFWLCKFDFVNISGRLLDYSLFMYSLDHDRDWIRRNHCFNLLYDWCLNHHWYFSFNKHWINLRWSHHGNRHHNGHSVILRSHWCLHNDRVRLLFFDSKGLWFLFQLARTHLWQYYFTLISVRSLFDFSRM